MPWISATDRNAVRYDIEVPLNERRKRCTTALNEPCDKQGQRLRGDMLIRGLRWRTQRQSGTTIIVLADLLSEGKRGWPSHVPHTKPDVIRLTSCRLDERARVRRRRQRISARSKAHAADVMSKRFCLGLLVWRNTIRFIQRDRATAAMRHHFFDVLLLSGALPECCASRAKLFVDLNSLARSTTEVTCLPE